MSTEPLTSDELDRLIRKHRQRLQTCVKGRGVWAETILGLAALEELKRLRAGIRVEGYISDRLVVRRQS